MSVDRAKILDKIKKCLASSASANEHEAAAAPRQAQSLMRLHDIGEAEIEWEATLAGSVADAFGCVHVSTCPRTARARGAS